MYPEGFSLIIGTINDEINFSQGKAPHQWQSGSVLKTGRREVPGSIPGGACRPSHSKFSVVFSETRVNTD